MKKIISLTTLLLLTILSTLAQTSYSIEFGTDSADISDTWANSRLPTENNGATVISRAGAGTNGGVTQITRAYVRFNDFPGTLPSNAIIDSARLKYHVNMPTWWSRSTTNQSYVQMVIGAWEDSTLTWNTQPSVDTTGQALTANYAAYYIGWDSVDVTDHVNYFLNNQGLYNGWRFQSVSESVYRLLTFSSREDSPEEAPKLKVWYHLPQAIELVDVYYDDVLDLVLNPSRNSFLDTIPSDSGKVLSKNTFKGNDEFIYTYPPSNFNGLIGITDVSAVDDISSSEMDFGLQLTSTQVTPIVSGALEPSIDRTSGSDYTIQFINDTVIVYEDTVIIYSKGLITEDMIGSKLAIVQTGTDDYVNFPVIKTTLDYTGSDYSLGLEDILLTTPYATATVPELENGEEFLWNRFPHMDEAELAAYNDSLIIWNNSDSIVWADTIPYNEYDSLWIIDTARVFTNSDWIIGTIIDSTGDTLKEIITRAGFQAIYIDSTLEDYEITDSTVLNESGSYSSPLYFYNQYVWEEGVYPEMEVKVLSRGATFQFGFDVDFDNTELDGVQPEYGVAVTNGTLYSVYNGSSSSLGIEVTENSIVGVGFNANEELVISVDGITITSIGTGVLVKEAVPKLSVSDAVLEHPKYYNCYYLPEVNVIRTKNYCGEAIGSLSADVSIGDMLLCKHPYWSGETTCPAAMGYTYTWRDQSGSAVSTSYSFTPSSIGIYSLEICGVTGSGMGFCYQPQYYFFGYEVDWGALNNVSRQPTYNSLTLNNAFTTLNVFGTTLSGYAANTVIGSSTANNIVKTGTDYWAYAEPHIAALSPLFSTEATSIHFNNGVSPVNYPRDYIAFNNYYGYNVVRIRHVTNANGSGPTQYYMVNENEVKMALYRSGSNLYGYYGTTSGMSTLQVSGGSTFTQPSLYGYLKIYPKPVINTGPVIGSANAFPSENDLEEPLVQIIDLIVVNDPSTLKVSLENCLTSLSCDDPYYNKAFHTLDGDYYHTASGYLYFAHEFDYDSGTLDYAVYREEDHVDVTASTAVAPTSRSYGYNQYALNAGNLTDGYYTLEINTEKDHKYILRFFKKY